MTRPVTPTTRGPAIPITIALVAGIVAAALMYVATGPLRLGQATPLLLPGPLVGLAVRLTTGGVSKPTAGIVCAIACAAAIAGFLAGDAAVWDPFLLAPALRRLFGTITGALLLAFTTYLAFIIAHRYG